MRSILVRTLLFFGLSAASTELLAVPLLSIYQGDPPKVSSASGDNDKAKRRSHEKVGLTKHAPNVLDRSSWENIETIVRLEEEAEREGSFAEADLEIQMF